jgi:uncharacterized membrane protein
MTAPAVVCWGSRLGWLGLAGTPYTFTAHLPAVIIFTVCAIGELIADKLPKTPKRTAPAPLIFRLVMGALCGVVLAAAGHAAMGLGIVFGAIGALIGSFGGYLVRHALTSRAGLPDFPVALVEDLIAVAGGLWVVSRF